MKIQWLRLNVHPGMDVSVSFLHLFVLQLLGLWLGRKNVLHFEAPVCSTAFQLSLGTAMERSKASKMISTSSWQVCSIKRVYPSITKRLIVYAASCAAAGSKFTIMIVCKVKYWMSSHDEWVVLFNFCDDAALFSSPTGEYRDHCGSAYLCGLREDPFNFSK